MFCPKCGKMNPDDRELCSGCNAVLHEPKPEAPKKKKSAAGKIIALIAAAAVVIGGSAAAVVSCDRDTTPVVAEACYIMLI
ncbi:MAG: hypothetical protein J1F63_07345 [Oscillospiraceae bacterium]|nr:hypothetical protein [Oscillospiraceae bacterium]